MALRTILVLACLLGSTHAGVAQEERSYPSFDYDVAQTHELKPHRRTIPMKGISSGFNQLRLLLTVTPAGDVLNAEASGEDKILKFWPGLRNEVLQWKFTPFEENGKAVTAEIEECIDLVPPERRPKRHVAPPVVRRDSRVEITLQRSGCFGSCPSYNVTVRTPRIVFNGHGFVVALGIHTDSVKPEDVRALARKFIAADFYSMDASYRAGVTDMPTYVLSIAVDGRKKEVEDYVGEWEGMPAIIRELEEEVDSFARTDRWITGSQGLVPALQLEGFNFQSFEAQLMLKQALMRGQTATVRELLQAGVPLKRLPAPKTADPSASNVFENAGLLTAAAGHPDTLQLLIDAGAGKDDQLDKDRALAGAANSGNLGAVRALIAYGADPNSDLSEHEMTETSGGMELSFPGAGSVLVYAAASGNPDVVREILRYNPKLEALDFQGRTAIFAAGAYRYGDKDGARVECVRLLAAAGADVNARDKNGNTPLHETFLSDVEEELLKLGADVNARNKDGETPIFTTVDYADGFDLLIAHGADLTIRNNRGETILQVAETKGPAFQEALHKAMLKRTPGSR